MTSQTGMQHANMINQQQQQQQQQQRRRQATTTNTLQPNRSIADNDDNAAPVTISTTACTPVAAVRNRADLEYRLVSLTM